MGKSFYHTHPIQVLTRIVIARQNANQFTPYYTAFMKGIWLRLFADLLQRNDMGKPVLLHHVRELSYQWFFFSKNLLVSFMER